MPWKDGVRSYVTGFNDSYDLILKDLIDYLFKNKILESNSKWTFTRYCILNTLFDYADEVIRDFEYTEDQLVELIERHGRLKSKFEGILQKKLKEKENKKKEVVVNIEQQ